MRSSMLNLALIRSGMNQPALIGRTSEADPCGRYSLHSPHLPLFNTTRTSVIRLSLCFSFSHRLPTFIMVDRSPSVAAIGVIGRHVSSHNVSNAWNFTLTLAKEQSSSHPPLPGYIFRRTRATPGQARVYLVAQFKSGHIRSADAI